MKAMEPTERMPSLGEQDYDVIVDFDETAEYGAWVPSDDLVWAACTLVQHACTVLPPGTYFELRSGECGVRLGRLCWYSSPYCRERKVGICVPASLISYGWAGRVEHG